MLSLRLSSAKKYVGLSLQNTDIRMSRLLYRTIANITAVTVIKNYYISSVRVFKSIFFMPADVFLILIKLD